MIFDDFTFMDTACRVMKQEDFSPGQEGMVIGLGRGKHPMVMAF